MSEPTGGGKSRGKSRGRGRASASVSKPSAGRGRGVSPVPQAPAPTSQAPAPAAQAPAPAARAPAPAAQAPAPAARAPAPAARAPAPVAQVPAPAAQAPAPAAQVPAPTSNLPSQGDTAGSSTGEENVGGVLTGRGGARSNRPPPQNTICTRPELYKNSKKGVSGTVVKLQANYFRLITQTKWTLYQYRVDISPEEDRTFVRKSLMKDHRAKLNGYLFDGTVLYTPHKLHPDPMVLISKRTEDGETMKMTLKLVGDVTPGDYVYIQVFNILMRKCYSSLKLQLLNRDFYDREAKIDINEYRLQIWPGYKTTIAQYEREILMVAEVTHKIIRTETVFDLLRSMQELYGRTNYQQHFSREIVGQIILTDYNNVTHRITDVRWDTTPASTFSMKGDDITYFDYYRKKYQVTIKDRTQPLLVTLAKARDIRRGHSNTSLLVPELCRMTGLTDQMRADFRLMKAISTHTRVGPAQRIDKLLQFNRRLRTAKECVAELKEWELQLDDKLVEVNGRILPQEMISQNNNVKYPSGDTNDGWTRSLRNNQMLVCIPVESWVVITCHRCERDTDNFVKMIIQTGEKMGIRLPKPICHSVSQDSVAIYMAKVEAILSNGQPTFMLCVLSSNKSDVYNAIKRKCTVDRNVPTQVVLSKTLTNKNALSIATKVAIQINCKVGGSPWSVPIPISDLMVIGYDVCHDPRDKQNSHGAMVASMDPLHSRYYSCVTRHANGEELANEFCLNIKKAVQQFQIRNKKLPGMIVIYRDGVGEGQISYVYTHEVEIIKKALADMYGTAQYRLSFIVVSKRLNTRFFYNRSNPKPGTVIDDVVTSPERYDFFLISQAVREGTVAPTSYNVLFDNTGLGPDRTQKLAYKFCHLYYNFAGQVRVPAPCQYAHKLAFLTSQSYGGAPHLGMSNFLHFL